MVDCTQSVMGRQRFPVSARGIQNCLSSPAEFFVYKQTISLKPGSCNGNEAVSKNVNYWQLDGADRTDGGTPIQSSDHERHTSMLRQKSLEGQPIYRSRWQHTR